MANEGFKFAEFQELKKAKYFKEYGKPMMVNKAKFAVCFVDLKQAGKKENARFVFFKKEKEAIDLFKVLKADKSHVIKKLGVVTVNVAGKEVTMDVTRGGLSNDVLKAKGEEFFMSNYKLTLVTPTSAAAPAATTEEATEETTTAPEAEATATAETAQEAASEQPAADSTEKAAPKMTPKRRAKVQENMKAIEAQLAKISKALKID